MERKIQLIYIKEPTILVYHIYDNYWEEKKVNLNYQFQSIQKKFIEMINIFIENVRNFKIFLTN